MTEQRGIGARLGIAALNIFSPGLGLLRLRRPRQALAYWLIVPAVAALMCLFWLLTPILSFPALMACAAILAVAALGSQVGSAWKSWTSSRLRTTTPLPVWARWYAIAAAYLLSALFTAYVVLDGVHRFYKPFYVPSEAMMPTLRIDDKLVASMRHPRSLKRGDVILLAVNGAMYIKRVAGLPGDRIALRDGVIILNRQPIVQRFIREEILDTPLGRAPARRLAEQFPGESAEHEIYDLEPTPVDDYPETLVKPGHLFVLGDNRDRSADSRVPHEQWGVEQLPVDDVRGLALYYTYGPSHRSGERITH